MMLPIRSARLARWQILLLTISGGLLWLSGSLWILLRYFGQVQGEFGPEPNPWQTWLLRLHGLLLIPVLMGIGGLLVAHVPMGWHSKAQRSTGVALLAIFGLLTISGYMLYYVGVDDVRSWTSVTHWVIGLAVPGLFLWHYTHVKRSRRRPVVR